MTTKRTRVSDICAWQEYVTGYEWKFYDNESERPIDAERYENLRHRLLERPPPTAAMQRGTNMHEALECMCEAVDGQVFEWLNHPAITVRF